MSKNCISENVVFHETLVIFHETTVFECETNFWNKKNRHFNKKVTVYRTSTKFELKKS